MRYAEASLIRWLFCCMRGENRAYTYTGRSMERSIVMQVSIAPAPEGVERFKCYAPGCEDEITTTHVFCRTDRKNRRFCTAKCYSAWRQAKARMA